ncbi:hypothetical protein GCM10007276_34300 [Agaricicola taiwanensis]|uniref:Uncharacterized protein n=1 Tax=Agaricicola taiwanensis TaxID=591372 RepID=A0A8J3E0H2_9RHOB|nr:hypothetical protein [Agaricicola taiwanensis]GGE54356.1 hypothetical protein GCM10007276_34300 [Agaricicola taiwanensis]
MADTSSDPHTAAGSPTAPTLFGVDLQEWREHGARKSNQPQNEDSGSQPSAADPADDLFAIIGLRKMIAATYPRFKSVLAAETAIQREHHPLSRSSRKAETWLEAGIDSTNRWTKAFEDYLHSGEVPEPELLAAFEHFRRMLLTRYLRSRNASHAIAVFFDRMAAAEAELDAARVAQTDELLVADEIDAEADGGLETLLAEARAAAGAAMLREVMAPLRRERDDAGFRAEKAEVRRQMAGRIRALPVFRLRETLRQGRWLGDDGEARVLPGVKLSRGVLVERYGKDILRRLPRGISAADGLDPDLIAGWFGYGSGDAMLVDLVQAPPSGSSSPP